MINIDDRRWEKLEEAGETVGEEEAMRKRERELDTRRWRRRRRRKKKKVGEAEIIGKKIGEEVKGDR